MEKLERVRVRVDSCTKAKRLGRKAYLLISKRMSTELDAPVRWLQCLAAVFAGAAGMSSASFSMVSMSV